jgi:predicted DNA-binding transcriptional regulator AlpA
MEILIMNENTLLKDTDAAEVLGCSVSWIRQLRVRGDGPSFVKVGRLVRYRLIDLQTWINARVRQNTMQA